MQVIPFVCINNFLYFHHVPCWDRYQEALVLVFYFFYMIFNSLIIFVGIHIHCYVYIRIEQNVRDGDVVKEPKDGISFSSIEEVRTYYTR